MSFEVLANVFKEELNACELDDFSSDSPLWIFAVDRVFNENESAEVEQKIGDFTANWLSHGQKVKSFGKLFFNRFIVLAADSSSALPGGCSIDSSVRFIKSIETDFGVGLFDRMLVFWIHENDEIYSTKYSKLSGLLDSGGFTLDTPIFDMTVRTVDEFIASWIKPASQSWLSRTLF